ncbi:hypothetical protein GCM10020219_006200 [Nonomuraea dietziae]
MLARQDDGRGERALGDGPEQFGVVGRGRRHDGGLEKGVRRQRPADLLGHDGQFGKAAAGSAVPLVDRQARDSEFSRETRPRRGRMGGEKGPHDGPQLGEAHDRRC